MHPRGKGYEKLPEDWRTYKPNAGEISRLRRFLTSCLLRDYGVLSHENGRYLLSHPERRFFNNFFQLLGDKKYPRKRAWQERFACYYDATAEALGVPCEVARTMLMTFQWWTGGTENMDRTLNYRTWLRGVPDIAEKLYFDRELVIDIIVESPKLRTLLKERLQSIKELWFERLQGPREVDYTRTAFAKTQEKCFRQWWRPVLARAIVEVPNYSIRTLHRYLYDFLEDDKCRERVFSRRPPPGTPKSYWPPQFSTKQTELASLVGGNYVKAP